MNPYHEQRIVRIRRKMTRSRYLNKAVYKYHRYELTIPSKYKYLDEACMKKDLKIEADMKTSAQL